MGDFRFLSLLGSILLVIAIDLITELLVFSPSAVAFLQQPSMLKPIILAGLVVFVMFLMPGYLIAALWEGDELLAGLTLAVTSCPAIVFFNHIPAQATLELLKIPYSYYYTAAALATMFGAFVRYEVKN